MDRSLKLMQRADEMVLTGTGTETAIPRRIKIDFLCVAVVQVNEEVERIVETLGNVIKKTLGRDGLHAYVVCHVPLLIL